MSMTIPHIKDMFKAGNPGFKPRFKIGASPDEIGHTIVRCLLYVAIIWMMMEII